MTPIVDLRGVARTFPTTPPVRAVRPTDLQISPGEFVAVVGASGSGKSTLMHLLGLLDQPSEGSYVFDGIDTSQMSDAERTALRGHAIGLVFQSFHLVGHRSALENVMLADTYTSAGEDGGGSERDRRSRAMEALRKVHLEHRADFMPNVLSGGEQQRVAIARALMTEPRLILADEPTGNLDSATSATVLDLFDELHRQGHTIVVITHSEEVSARAQRRITISDGNVHSGMPAAPVRAGGPAADRVTVPAGAVPVPVGVPAARPAIPPSRMRLRDLLAEAAAGIAAKPARTFLTTSGTILGIAALVATLGLAATSGSQIVSHFDELAATQVVVTDARGDISDPLVDIDPPPQRLPWDADARLAQLNGVVAAGSVAPVDIGERRIAAVTVVDPLAADTLTAQVFAASPGLFDAVRSDLVTGRWFDHGHDARADAVAVIGASLAQSLNIANLDHRPAVFIGDDPYAVIAILSDPPRLPRLMNAIVIPNGTAQLRFGLDSPADVHIDTEVGAALQVAQEAPLALAPNAPGDLQAQLPPEPRRIRNQISEDLQALFLGLAGLSLLIGALGIANITLVAVLERVSEIGIRRSLGATRPHIAGQFIVETTGLGLLGGIIGASAGLLATVVVAAARGWTPVLPTWLLLIAPLLGAGVGALAGLYPALRAARIEPIAALRTT